MTTNRLGSSSTPNAPTPSVVAGLSPGHRPVPYSKPIPKVFPPTSETAAKVAMLTVYALMAVTIVFIALREAGLFD